MFSLSPAVTHALALAARLETAAPDGVLKPVDTGAAKTLGRAFAKKRVSFGRFGGFAPNNGVGGA